MHKIFEWSTTELLLGANQFEIPLLSIGFMVAFLAILQLKKTSDLFCIVSSRTFTLQ